MNQTLGFKMRRKRLTLMLPLSPREKSSSPTIRGPSSTLKLSTDPSIRDQKDRPRKAQIKINRPMRDQYVYDKLANGRPV